MKRKRSDLNASTPALPELRFYVCVAIYPQDPGSDGATRVLAFNHGYSREILLNNEEVAAIRQDIQIVRAYSSAH